MKRLLIALLFPLALAAQTTVIVNFDNPACRANATPGTYQGIIFTTGTPWDCEASGYPGASGLSLSWTQNIQSGTFRFVSPSIFNSFQFASSMTNTSLTVKTDAGESLTITPKQSFTAYQTGFQKPATNVSFSCTCGWTFEMDDITYTVPPPLPPPPLVVPIAGLGHVTFPLQGPTAQMVCNPSDGPCSIVLTFCDTSTPQNCYTANAGVLTVQKILSGQVPQSTVIAIVGP